MEWSLSNSIPAMVGLIYVSKKKKMNTTTMKIVIRGIDSLVGLFCRILSIVLLGISFMTFCFCCLSCVGGGSEISDFISLHLSGLYFLAAVGMWGFGILVDACFKYLVKDEQKFQEDS